MNRPCRAEAFAVVTFLAGLAGCAQDQSQLEMEPTRSALAAVTTPIDPIALASLLAVAPESLRAAGEERYLRQAYDSARDIWRVEAARAHAVSDGVAEARVRMWLGLAEWRLGNFGPARQEGDSAVQLKRRFGLDDELSRSFNALGLLAWHEGRYQDALQHFDSAIVSARRHNDSTGMARAAANIPLIQVELGQYDSARQGLLNAIQVSRLIGHDLLHANSLANLAMLEIRLGYPSLALPLLAEARQRYAEIEYLTGESNALGQLATAFGALGDLQRAIVAADSGLAIARAQGLQQEMAATLEVLADLHLQGGSSRLALRHLREADSLDALLGLAAERGSNLRRMSAILLELSEPAPAAARAGEALQVHQGIDANADAVYDRLQLALALAAQGDHHRARSQAESAREEAIRLGNAFAARDANVVMARLALDEGDPRQALRQLTSRTLLPVVNDWNLADLRAQALLALGRTEEAREEGERAVAALERERASLGAGPLRSSYLASRTGPFARLVAIHLVRGDTTAAFEVAAGVPGRSLAERLGGVSGGKGTIGETAERERLLIRAAALERELALPGNEERRTSLEQALHATQTSFENHLTSRAVGSNEGLLGLASVKLDEIQSRLAPDVALLLFLSGPERLDLFVVRRESLFHRSAPIGSQALTARVRFVREMLGGASSNAVIPPALGELHDLLLGPVETAGHLEGVSQLLIVPHGSLGALPFAALWNRKAGRFLVEDYIVSYLPTVAALSAEHPAGPIQLGRMAVFAPLPDSLPGTAREARAITRHMAVAELRIGRASSEARVRTALETGRPVHLASHGAHNPQNPLFSRMVVGGGGAGGGEREDGNLQVHEILGLTSTSPLVFLSGCETGLGGAGQTHFDQEFEEGSLSHAMLIAGVGTVVATLWRVEDAGAAALADRFYHYLRSGRRPEEALARAQREMITARGGFTWAAYVVLGRGGPQIGAPGPYNLN
jgi:CHAT domain-containing protein